MTASTIILRRAFSQDPSNTMYALGLLHAYREIHKWDEMSDHVVNLFLKQVSIEGYCG